jgi:aminopeptidase N
VLGERLDSSRAPYAYAFITYGKGALVIDMLAQTVGEQKFNAILRDLFAHETFISTESLLGYVSRGASRDLQPFSKYFVYGTGVPEIEYQVDVRGGAGKWTIHLTGERVDPWRYRIRVAKRDDGALDVVRESVPVASAPLPTLLVPMQVALENRTKTDEGLKYAKRMIDLSAPKFALDFDIPWEPKDVALDRDREVLALVYTKGRNAKEVLLKRGVNLAAAGKTSEAEATFKEGLAAKASTELQSALNHLAPIGLSLPAGVDIGSSYKSILLDVQNQISNAALHLSLARLYIDQGKTAPAADEVKQANRALDSDYHPWIDDEVALLEARLDMRRGEYKSAFDRLSKSMKENGGDSAEAYALLAIAAKQSGQTAELQRAIDGARELGVDVTAIGN